jgi:L-lactate dehydrogenase complex protein LldE
VKTFADYDRTIVISGSCALHVRAHASHFGVSGAHVAAHTMELCSYLHDVIGVERIATLGASFPRRVAVHTGCHGLRGLGLASPSELQVGRYDKVRALLGTVSGISFATLTRPDECCGFGGSFAVGEPAVSVKMGRDRLEDYESGSAEAVVSTDVSCLMHLQGLARRDGVALPMVHVAQVLAGTAEQKQVPLFARDDTRA